MKKRGKKIKLSQSLSFNAKAAGFTIWFAYLYIIVEIFYKVRIEKVPCTFEVILLFLIFAIYGILSKLFSGYQLPCDHKGNPLPTGKIKADKRKRNSFYRRSALIYAFVFLFISIIAFSSSSLLSNVNVSSQLFFDTDMPNFVLAVIISVIFFPLIYIFAYMIEFLWYEYKVSVYNEIMEEKAEEEARHRELLLKVEEEIANEALAEPVPKKRGRPKKVDTDMVAAAAVVSAEAPKRRGRPAKSASTTKE